MLCLSSASAGNGSGQAAGLESTIVDDAIMALLESVRSGQLAPAAAAMQLRERSAGYQQVRVHHFSAHLVLLGGIMSEPKVAVLQLFDSFPTGMARFVCYALLLKAQLACGLDCCAKASAQALGFVQWIGWQGCCQGFHRCRFYTVCSTGS